MVISWNVILNLLLKDFLLPLFVAFIDFLFLFLRPEWIFFLSLLLPFFLAAEQSDTAVVRK